MKKLGKRPEETTVAVQGFGNAGSFMVKILIGLGYKVIAVSDSKGGVVFSNNITIEQFNNKVTIIFFGSTTNSVTVLNSLFLSFNNLAIKQFNNYF